MTKAISLISALLLLCGIANLPLGYYTFLRISIFGTSVYIMLRGLDGRPIAWMILFGIVAIIFNPVIPIYLYKKSLWIPIDGAGAALFLFYGLGKKQSQKVYEK